MTDRQIFFTAPDGVVYRVLDVVMKDGILHASNPPASWAKSRLFRPREGQRRLYLFARDEDRTPTGEHLDRQFAVAEFLATNAFDANQRTPR